MVCRSLSDSLSRGGDEDEDSAADATRFELSEDGARHEEILTITSRSYLSAGFAKSVFAFT